MNQETKIETAQGNTSHGLAARAGLMGLAAMIFFATACSVFAGDVDLEKTGWKATLPCTVYADDPANASYLASGWMGNHEAMKMNDKCADNPQAGKACIEIQYTATDNWAGIAWQVPVNNWGETPGGMDLTGAKKLTFWARGKEGGEVVKFEYGILGKDKKYWDTARGDALEVTLTKEWKEYSFDLTGKDLSRIVTGFVFALAGQGKPITFYLDEIKYVKE